jgi:dipeptidyl aminopeptidase/acylaminoacyl peptidase
MRTFVWVWFGLFLCCATSECADKRPVTVEDCVQVRRVTAVQMSPDAKQVAYIVKSPSVVNNQNDYQLYLRSLDQTARKDNGQLLFQAASLSGLRWLGDNRLAVLSQVGGKYAINFIDCKTGKIETQISRTSTIEDYTASSNGKVLAFTVNVDTVSSESEKQHELRGQVMVGRSQGYEYPREVYLAERAENGQRILTRILNGDVAGKPSHAEVKTSFSFANRLSLSPDGRFLVFRYMLAVDAVPEHWKTNPFIVRVALPTGGTTEVLGLYDVNAHRLRLAIDSPKADSRVFWSTDSRAFFVSVVPLVNDSYWKTFEGATPLFTIAIFRRHMYTVDVQSGIVSQVLPDFSKEEEVPISWKQAEGEMILRLDPKTYVRMVRDGTAWKEIARFSSSATSSIGDTAVTGSAGVMVGVYENTAAPPELFMQRIGSDESLILTDLNPELRTVSLGKIEEIEWTNEYAAHTSGYLIKPVGYEAGKRYPLVIMSYYWSDAFVCDGAGSFHTTGFPPQPLASAGFLVLMANPPSDAEQPKEQTGVLLEAYNWISMIESAAKLLVDRGMADSNEIGLSGWSRTSWKTDFLLTHSNLKLAAASSADGGGFNYGVYWMFPEFWTPEYEAMYHGPPYGTTFQNWLNYAPAFNAYRVQTPLLMEYTSESSGKSGAPYNAYEFVASLNRQGKPVELFFYPRGKHALDSPFERVASLQRNVDWFRFWMQGHEGKAPDYDPDQYERWHKLRQQQEWNDRMRAGGKDSALEFLRQTSPGAVVNDTERAPAAKEFMYDQ